MIVLDTHAVYYLATSPESLGRAAKRACDHGPQLGVPTICLWEIGMLAEKGRISLRGSLQSWADALLESPRLVALPLTPDIAVRAAGLGIHGDPADRFIVATALVHRAKLVTRDALIAQSKLVATVWD